MTNRIPIDKTTYTDAERLLHEMIVASTQTMLVKAATVTHVLSINHERGANILTQAMLEATQEMGTELERAKMPTKIEDNIRILRVVEFSGPRSLVEDQVAQSIHGTKRLPNGLTIKAATVGAFPEILEDFGDGQTNPA